MGLFGGTRIHVDERTARASDPIDVCGPVSGRTFSGSCLGKIEMAAATLTFLGSDCCRLEANFRQLQAERCLRRLRLLAVAGGALAILEMVLAVQLYISGGMESGWVRALLPPICALFLAVALSLSLARANAWAIAQRGGALVTALATALVAIGTGICVLAHSPLHLASLGGAPRRHAFALGGACAGISLLALLAPRFVEVAVALPVLLCGFVAEAWWLHLASAPPPLSEASPSCWTELARDSALLFGLGGVALGVTRQHELAARHELLLRRELQASYAAVANNFARAAREEMPEARTHVDPLPLDDPRHGAEKAFARRAWEEHDEPVAAAAEARYRAG